MNDLLEQLAHLSPEQRAALFNKLQQRRLSKPGDGDAPSAAIPPCDRSAPIPLSFPQEQLWFLDQLQPGSVDYNERWALRVDGNLAIDALERAIREVTRRHESLRTTFPVVDGQPTQAIHPFDPEAPVLQIQALAATEDAAELEHRLDEATYQPFDLTLGPLWRVVLFRRSPDHHVLLLVTHHIIADAWSMAIFLQEMVSLYAGFQRGQAASLPGLPLQYADFAHWQRQRLQGVALARKIDFWRDHLEGAPGLLPLPADRPRPPVPSQRGGMRRFTLDAGLARQLKQFGGQTGATLFTTLFSAFTVLLHRYTGQEDIVVGTVTANRAQPELEALIGHFVNTLALRTRLSGEMGFRDVLQQVHGLMQSSHDCHDTPFEKLVQALQPVRDLGHHPLFQVSFNLHNQPGIDNLSPPGLRLTPLAFASKTAKLDLYLLMYETAEGLAGEFEYSLDLFDAATVERMIGNFRTLLEGIAADPGRPVHALPLLAEAERQQLIAWNRTEADYPRDRTVVDLFERQAEQTPGNIAVVFEGQSLSYAELNARANRLAHRLLGLKAEDGRPLVQPDALVAVCVERSLEMVIGLLGVLKAGAAYVPIDPGYPKERVAFMLADSAAPVLLTQAALLARLPVEGLERACQALCLDQAGFADYPAHNPPPQSRPDSLAYVIYTSGSTGRPKGVAVEHQGLALHIQAMLRHYAMTPADKVLQFASFSFDISLEQCLLAWLSGACSVMAGTKLMVAEDMLTLLEEQAASVADFSPAYWRQMLEADHAAEALRHLRILILGGEALPSGLALQTRRSFPALACFNSYGPTEAVIAPAVYRLPESLADNTAYISIGRPRANTRIHILDGHGQPLPPGVPGELCIAGAGLARGYLNRPELTAEKFVEVEVFGQVERVYKTGDLARWLPDGNLEFLGRLDHQVKLRGFRIELGEIEAALAQHEAVREAVVLLYQGDGNPRLVAYLVASDPWLVVSGKPAERDAHGTSSALATLYLPLSTYLKARLPDYMVPAHVQVLDRLPLTPNGKIDRQALPAPDAAAREEGFEAPATPTEELLAGLWAALLERDGIGRGDDFFALGGHSLLATQLAARVRAQFRVELPIRAVFEHPRLAGLARAIDRATFGAATLPPIEPPPADEPKVLSFAQQRLWFLAQWEGGGDATYNMPLALALDGALDIEALRASLAWLLERHESLRHCFPAVDGQAQVLVRPLEAGEALIVHDLSALAADAQAQEVQRRADAHALAPFDLAAGPLFKADLLVLGAGRHALLLNLHHIVGDGWSWGVLRRDWQQAYAAFAQGQEPALPAPRLQYSDYAAWQRRWLQGDVLQAQLDYWAAQLDGCPALLELPTDRPRPPQQSHRGARHAQTLPSALTASLKPLGQQHGATLFMTLLAAFDVLLARHSRQDDLCVGTPVANRTHHQAEDLVGFFVNTLVLRARLAPGQTFAGLLAEVRETCLAAYARQDLPFEALVERLRPERRPGHSPLFQVMFVLQNNDSPALALPGLDAKPLAQDYPVAKFDLTLHMEEHDGQLHGHWEYAADLFDAATIERMAGHFETLLKGIAADPGRPLHALPLMTGAECEQLIAWNRTETDYPLGQTIVGLFERQVEQTPGHIAVVFEGQSLTYAELNAQANRLAHRLLSLKAEDGQPLVQPDALVAIAVERSLEMVVGLLGILKAGAAYVPIDPSYPEERIAFMLADSAAPVLLTQAALLARLPVAGLGHPCQALCLDQAGFADYPAHNPPPHSRPDSLAYVIYTSGSTGRPKGVMIEHGGLVNLTLAQTRAFHINSRSRLLQFASFSFDASVSEIMTALLSGASLYLASTATLLSDSTFSDYADRHALTQATLPPSFLSTLAANGLTSLQTLVVAGEACPPEWVSHWATGRRFINAYGPTEATVCASVFECQPDGQKPPIGKPIANTRIYVLDGHGQPLPPGVPGELCIAGAGLARGYLNRPELTAEKFVEVDLFGQVERVYKTGDLARWRPDGQLEFLGRLDHQVKLRGFRIELGEIEAALAAHAAVREAVVVLYQGDGNPRLAAYLVASDPWLGVSGKQAEREAHGTSSALATLPSQLSTYLKARLPDYMVPAHLQILDRLPLTPNGKIDRQALPAPGAGAGEDYELPRNEVERRLAGVWADVLKRPDVGVHDNFFALGGDSILSIQIVARARQAGLQLTPRDLFEHQTVAELARAARFGAAVAAEQGPVQGEAPLTPIQQWFFAQDFSQPAHFNQSMLLCAPVDLSVDALRRAFIAVLGHHDALRLRYARAGGGWRQHFVDMPGDAENPLHVEDLRGQAPAAPAAALLARTGHYQASLDLAEGPLTRLVLFQLDDGARLFWCVHHLAVDGVSWRLLLDDLNTAYAQALAGQPVRLPAKTSSFKAWAERLAAYAESDAAATELAYWQFIPRQTLPVDFPEGRNRLEHARHHPLEWDAEATRALLEDAPAAYRTRINDLLLAALALALCDWTGNLECVVDLEGHGRAALFEDIDLTRTVGWFTTVHPVALRLPTRTGDTATDLGRALKAVKEQLRGIPHDGIGHGLLAHRRGEPLPRGDILFNYLGQFDQSVEAGLLAFAAEATASDIDGHGPRDHRIDINGAVRQGRLRLAWSYSGECYQDETIARLANRYQTHLDALVAHCRGGARGLTPSDVPLAGMAQDSLDGLCARHPGLQDLYPLSPLQQGMLFHALYEPESGVYFKQLRLTLSNLDPAAFQAAWQLQLQRHPVLRSAFLGGHSPALQIVLADAPLPWAEHDWRGLPEAGQPARLDALLAQQRARGFDLAQAPLLRFDLARLDEDRYAFLWHSHHLLTDGWCLPIIFSEVRDSYLAFRQGRTPQLPSVRPYRDYLAWLARQDLDAARAHWAGRLAGFAAPTPIPLLGRPTDRPDYREAHYPLDAATHRQLQRFGQAHRLTLNTLVQGAWALLLSRHSGEADVCFGVTVSGRNAALDGIERMVGLFINTLPLRVAVGPDDTVKDWLQRLQRRHQDDQRYAYAPLHEIQARSAVPNGTALFDSLLVFENYPLGDALETPAGSFVIEAFEAVEQTYHPLTLVAIPGDSLAFRLDYDATRLDEAAVERLWGHLETLLNGIAADPGRPVHALPLMTEAERQQLLAWNRTETDYPQDQTIVGLFEQQVEKTPGHTAVVFEGQSLSYAELNARANRLAHRLLGLKAGDGAPLVRPDALVAVCVERSLEMVIGLLGILKAGAAYVPVDPGYPEERIAFMLEDSAASALLTQAALLGELPVEGLGRTCQALCLDEADFADYPTHNPPPHSRPDSLAYVIYTSGSTGRPKGVMIEHGSLVNLTLAQTRAFHIDSRSRLLQFASFSFDASVSEIMTALLSGASLYLASTATLLSDSAFSDYADAHALTQATLPPSFLSTVAAKGLISLQTLVVAGEACPPEWVSHWAPGRRFINAYGPTEATVCASVFECQPDGQKPPIGKPIANTRIHILDAHGQPLPPGVPGELCIAGAGLARGYLNRPELTAEKFIEIEIFGQVERVYKTGDLARWLPDGNLEFLGRLDHQVKLRGFRIELGEIEAALAAHEAVREAVVALYQGDGNPRLVAYLVASDPWLVVSGKPAERDAHGASSSLATLHSPLSTYLKARLPDYMVPAHIQLLDRLPLTPNGKVDRQALPAPGGGTGQTRSGLPRDAVELRLLHLWETVLQAPSLGVHDDFFALGGHSLLAVKLMSYIQQAFGRRLPVSLLFTHPTVAGLAEALRGAEPAIPPAPLVPLQPHGQGLPVHCLPGAIGSVLYLYPLASRLGTGQPVYALPTPGLDGAPTPPTVQALAAYHLEALRQRQPHGPYQLVGHSSGGRVAFEMAWQLEQQGETVALLAMLDATAPDPGAVDAAAGHTELHWLLDIAKVFEDLAGLDFGVTLDALQAQPALEEAYALVLRAFQQREVLFAPGAPADELKSLVEVYRATTKAHLDYRVPGQVRCPIRLFQADEPMTGAAVEDTREAWGWAACTQAGVEVIAAPGNHFTIMAEPHVQCLAEQLGARLHTCSVALVKGAAVLVDASHN